MKFYSLIIILLASISFGFTQKVADYTLADYYHHFYEADLSDIIDNDYETAFSQKELHVYEHDTINNKLEFRTSNTPLYWDGDSNIEYFYTIAFWERNKGQRVLLVLESENTWVSDEALSMEFFIHNKKGIRPYDLIGSGLNFDFFTEEENHKTFFPQSFLDEPPYYVYDIRNDTIIVAFGIHEYYEPMELFDTFKSLDISTYDILIDPRKGTYTKRVQR